MIFKKIDVVWIFLDHCLPYIYQRSELNQRANKDSIFSILQILKKIRSYSLMNPCENRLYMDLS